MCNVPTMKAKHLITSRHGMRRDGRNVGEMWCHLHLSHTSTRWHHFVVYRDIISVRLMFWMVVIYEQRLVFRRIRGVLIFNFLNLNMDDIVSGLSCS